MVRHHILRFVTHLLHCRSWVSDADCRSAVRIVVVNGARHHNRSMRRKQRFDGRCCQGYSIFFCTNNVDNNDNSLREIYCASRLVPLFPVARPYVVRSLHVLRHTMCWRAPMSLASLRSVQSQLQVATRQPTRPETVAISTTTKASSTTGTSVTVASIRGPVRYQYRCRTNNSHPSSSKLYEDAIGDRIPVSDQIGPTGMA